MRSHNSNLNDPRYKEYYRVLADIIAIFWAFHKERVQIGNIEFAYNGFDDMRPFDPQARVDYNRENHLEGEFDVVAEFAESARLAMSASWLQYIGEHGFNEPLRFFGIPLVSGEAKRFVDPYVKELIRNATPLVERLTKTPNKDVESIIVAGIGTALPIAVQLSALFGENSPKRTALLARIRIEEITFAGSKIGIKQKGPLGHDVPSDYDLLDDSEIGLGKVFLRQVGLEDTHGCPAGRGLSHETRQFLRDRGVETTKPMILDFADYVAGQFDRYVGGWYRGLDTEGKRWLDPECERVLSGRARQEAMGLKGSHNGSSFSPERM